MKKRPFDRIIPIFTPKVWTAGLLGLSLSDIGALHVAPNQEAFIELVRISSEAKVLVISPDAPISGEECERLIERVREYSGLQIIVGYREHQISDRASIVKEKVIAVQFCFLPRAIRQAIADAEKGEAV